MVFTFLIFLNILYFLAFVSLLTRSSWQWAKQGTDIFWSCYPYSGYFKYSKLGQWVHIHYSYIKAQDIINLFTNQNRVFWSTEIRTAQICSITGTSDNYFSFSLLLPLLTSFVNYTVTAISDNHRITEL